MKHLPTPLQIAEARHVTENWRRYPQSYVTLCNRCLAQWGLA